MNGESKVVPGYEELHKVLMRALEQASSGKGKDRHANDDAFENQIMCYMAGQIGMAAPVFQVVKKSVEACRLPYPQNVNELLGAINYAAGAVIECERKREKEYRAAEKLSKCTNESLEESIAGGLVDSLNAPGNCLKALVSSPIKGVNA